MTDPFTLLEAHRPFVRDTLPGERAAARSILEAAIQAEVPSPALSPLPSRRPRRRSLALAGAAAAAVGVAAATLFWPSSTPSALAGWEPEIGVVTPEDEALIDAACRAPSEGFLPGGAEVVAVDARGTIALATYEGSANNEGVTVLQCLVHGDVSGWSNIDPDRNGYIGGSGISLAVPLVEAGTAHGEGIHILTGRVQDSVARVVVVHDGERLDARVTEGFFSAFWPSETPPTEVTIELYDASGALVDSIDVPAPSGRPDEGEGTTTGEVQVNGSSGSTLVEIPLDD